jgi:nucleoside-diphosphate-sugar epimerase
MAPRSTRTVVLTGASGVVGRAVAKELTDEYVIGLVHNDHDVPEVDEVLTSDLARPRMGLSEERWQALARQADVIVHSGALTTWGQPAERYREINIDGTRRVIELARSAEAPIHLISTAFVRAIERGLVDQLTPGNVVKPYIRSKFQAEQLLATSGIPHTIFRPTNLIGDSSTGESSRPQIVQMMSDWICRGKAPFFPAHPGNLVDIVPLDVLSRAVAGAVRSGENGHLYWVTYGERAMSVEDALEILAEHAQSLGRDIARGPVVDPREQLPVELDEIPATSRAFVAVMIDVSEITHACGGVLPTSLNELRDHFAVAIPGDADAYRASLRYWAKERERGEQYAKATS